MKLLNVLLSLYFFVSGCASSQSEDKSKPYIQTITCFDSARDCHDQALVACPNGYRVVNKVKGEKSESKTLYRVAVLCRANPYKKAY